jgi:hypothetical protein
MAHRYAELILQIARQDGIRSVLRSPDGQQLQVPASDKATRANFGTHRTDTSHTDTFYSHFIATASTDNTARLYNTKLHQPQSGQSLKPITARVYCVAISHDRACGEAIIQRRKFDSGLLRPYSSE